MLREGGRSSSLDLTLQTQRCLGRRKTARVGLPPNSTVRNRAVRDTRRRFWTRPETERHPEDPLKRRSRLRGKDSWLDSRTCEVGSSAFSNWSGRGGDSIGRAPSQQTEHGLEERMRWSRALHRDHRSTNAQEAKEDVSTRGRAILRGFFEPRMG